MQFPRNLALNGSTLKWTVLRKVCLWWLRLVGVVFCKYVISFARLYFFELFFFSDFTHKQTFSFQLFLYLLYSPSYLVFSFFLSFDFLPLSLSLTLNISFSPFSIFSLYFLRYTFLKTKSESLSERVQHQQPAEQLRRPSRQGLHDQPRSRRRQRPLPEQHDAHQVKILIRTASFRCTNKWKKRQNNSTFCNSTFCRRHFVIRSFASRHFAMHSFLFLVFTTFSTTSYFYV